MKRTKKNKKDKLIPNESIKKIHNVFITTADIIKIESVTLYSNTSSIDSVDSAIEPQNYKQNIVPNTNLTQPDSSGLSVNITIIILFMQKRKWMFWMY